MYDKILEEDIDKEKQPLAMKVLRWLAVSYRPLSILEISEVCAIPPESELRGATTLSSDRLLTCEDLLKLLPNLVVSVQADCSNEEGPGYSSLAFAHISVQEYLIGSRSANFGIQLRDAHTLVAKECLAYLFISPELESESCLARYASEHWNLHAIATGELDEDSRKNAFLLSASMLAVTLPIDNMKLLEEFLRVTQWLEGPENIEKLISSLRAWSHLTQGGKMRLAILYPKDRTEVMIRCRAHTVSHVYAPSYEAIYCHSPTAITTTTAVTSSTNFSRTYLQPNIMTAKRTTSSYGPPPRPPYSTANSIQLNDRPCRVSGDTFQLLQSLRQASTTVRLIWENSICRDRASTLEQNRVMSTRSMYSHAERVMVPLRVDTNLQPPLHG